MKNFGVIHVESNAIVAVEDLDKFGRGLIKVSSDYSHADLVPCGNELATCIETSRRPSNSEMHSRTAFELP